MRKIDFSKVEVFDAEVMAQDADRIELRTNRTGGGIRLSCEGFEDSRFLAMDMVLLEDHAQPFFLLFREKATPPAAPEDFRVMSGIHPRLPVTWVFDFHLLDSQHLFPYRTPGRQKMVIYGKRNHIRNMGTVTLRIKESFHPVHILLSNPRLLDAEPDYLRPAMDLLDEMGQYVPGNWPGKQSSIGAMVSALRLQAESCAAEPVAFHNPRWSLWGGSLDLRLTPGSGRFSTHYDGRRHWLVDPDGYAFFSIGPDCIGGDRSTRVDVMRHVLRWVPGEDEYPEAVRHPKRPDGSHDAMEVDYPAINLMRAFGSDWRKKWTDMTAVRLRSWGFNTVGNWTDPAFCKASGLPYVIPLDTLHAFPTTKAKIFRDFPDVFSEEYRLDADAYARPLADFRDDPCLIGYFLCNEPNWAFEEGLNLGAEVLAYPDALETKERLIAFLRARYEDSVQRINDAWGTSFTDFNDLRTPLAGAHFLSEASARDLGDFMEEMVRAYVTIPSQACRKVDPLSLNLGMRWGWIHDPRQVAGWEQFDVFSINCYSMDPRPAVEAVVKAGVHRPVMIGEFHHGALDGGTPATGIRGVRTQADRARAYRYYVEQGATTSHLVGCHYFDYNDQSAVGRFDGENYNIGFVDACQQPYPEMVGAARATAEVLYAVASGEQQAFTDCPDEIPSIFY